MAYSRSMMTPLVLCVSLLLFTSLPSSEGQFFTRQVTKLVPRMGRRGQQVVVSSDGEATLLAPAASVPPHSIVDRAYEVTLFRIKTI